MAGNKSSEGTRTPIESKEPRIGNTPPKKITTLECMDCGFREVFTERQFNFTDGLSCYICNGPVNRVITTPGEKIRNRRMKEFTKMIGNNEIKFNGMDFASERDYAALGIQVNVDVSDALKGLKAIQREAKKATATLKALEEHKPEKLLIVKVDTMLTKEEHDAIQNRVKQGIEDGVLLLDKYLTDYEVVEGEFKTIVTGRDNVG